MLVFMLLEIDSLTLHMYRCGFICMSVGIWDDIVNPMYGYGVQITPDINPIYVWLGRSCPRESKNVLFVDEGLV